MERTVFWGLVEGQGHAHLSSNCCVHALIPMGVWCRSDTSDQNQWIKKSTVQLKWSSGNTYEGSTKKEDVFFGRGGVFFLEPPFNGCVSDPLCFHSSQILVDFFTRACI